MSKRKFSTQLARQIGEALVVAELGRRGIVATSFAGNVPDIDLLAYFAGSTLHLQVKSWRSASVNLDAARFIRLTMEGTRQEIHELDSDLDLELIYVFVLVGEKVGDDNYFVLTQGALQKIVHVHHSAFLAKHKGVRPKNPDSTQMGLQLRDLEAHRGRWDVIEARLCKV